MQTRSQRWSQVAWERVRAAGAELTDTKQRQQYRTSCRKMPGLLHQAGVLQAVVFQVARDERGRRYIDDLCAGLQATGAVPSASYKSLIPHLQQLPSAQYMAITTEVAQLATWFSKFATVVFDDVEEQDGA